MQIYTNIYTYITSNLIPIVRSNLAVISSHWNLLFAAYILYHLPDITCLRYFPNLFWYRASCGTWKKIQVHNVTTCKSTRCIRTMEIRFISQRRDVGLADIISDKCVRSHGKRCWGGKISRARASIMLLDNVISYYVQNHEIMKYSSWVRDYVTFL